MKLFNRCLPLFHSYGKWETFTRGPIINPETGGKTGDFIVQTRTCERCGKMQIRRIRA